MAKCAIINGECPKTSDPDAKRFCPAWDEHGIVWEKNDGTTLVYNCAFQSLAPALMNVMKAGNRAAASAESNRNEIVTGLGNVANAIQQVDMTLLENKNDNDR